MTNNTNIETQENKDKRRMTNEDDDLKDKFEVSESKLESLTKHMHNSEKYA